MKKRKWTEEKALRSIIKNGRVSQKKDPLGNLELLVERGSVGNGTLGAIDFMNKETHIGVRVIGKI